MAAGVEEGPRPEVVARRDQDRAPGHLHSQEAAGLGQVFLTADADPAGREDRVPLECKDARLGVEAARQAAGHLDRLQHRIELRPIEERHAVVVHCPRFYPSARNAVTAARPSLQLLGCGSEGEQWRGSRCVSW